MDVTQRRSKDSSHINEKREREFDEPLDEWTDSESNCNGGPPQEAWTVSNTIRRENEDRNGGPSRATPSPAISDVGCNLISFG